MPYGSTTVYERLLQHTKHACLLGSTASLLQWDQQTMMPPGGLAYRSRQLAQLARLRHDMFTDPRVGELLAACEADSDLTGEPRSPTAVNLRELRREYDRATSLPSDLVEELARTRTIAQAEWAEARRASDFARFRPWLEKLVGLLRSQAHCFGWPEDGEPWDALAEGYEPGCTAKQIEALFGPLRQRLMNLLGALLGAVTRPSEAFLGLSLPIDRQERFVRFVAQRIGFDFTRGRLDQSVHPFCTGTHCHDVRMTTRFGIDKLLDALGSTMHETGHGIYGQGLSAQHTDTPMGSAVSLGIHESQSRLWENHVGRSRPFWIWCFPKLREFFGPVVRPFDLETVYRGLNIVKPDFIRVEADEVTYNLHIMVRFELERAIVAGDLEVADVPEAWNHKYKEYLNIDVPDDARGCLQDIHWSLGSMGYFPTYALGNLYAAQLFEKAVADIPDLHEQFARGEFDGLKAWLQENIHRHGQRYRAAELCEQVSGRPLSVQPLLHQLESKYRPLYGLAT